MELTWKALSEDDARSFAALSRAVAKRDSSPAVEVSEADVHDAAAEGLDLERNSLGAWDAERLVAAGYATTSSHLVPESSFPGDEPELVRALVFGLVDPEYRQAGIGSELTARLETRAGELAAERFPGRRYFIEASAWMHDDAQVKFYARRGYAPARYWTVMSRRAERITVPAVEGVHFRTLQEEDMSRVGRLHHEVFKDHWGDWAFDAETWPEVWNSRRRDWRVSLAAEDTETGQLLGYLVTDDHGAGEAYMEFLGTARAARGRGIARGILERAVRAAAQAGYEIVSLDVDSESPSGANEFYMRHGFVPVRTEVTMRTEVFDPEFAKNTTTVGESLASGESMCESNSGR